ncbi:MAG: class I SAM-dependent methyltransferase [Gammaproteobacteria bacterium]|nr:class I SAM-dependent methyltransferase [Gammaproteobacteria bacterium]
MESHIARILEPELMTDEEQARSYAEADFSESNTLFVDLFQQHFPDFDGHRAVDMGCGPGDIALRMARRYTGLHLDAVDGSAAMLSFGQPALAAAGEPGKRVRLVHGIFPGVELAVGEYDAVISNSLLHHLHEPKIMWQTVAQLGRPGASVLIMDLKRTRDAEHAREIVASYAGNEPEVLQLDFYNSLLAAFTPSEVRQQLAEAGLDGLSVFEVSDRHLMVTGRLAD